MHRELHPTREELPRDDHRHFVFENLDFPATREDLIRYAADAELEPALLNLARSLPDRDYSGPMDVWRAMGEASRRFGVGARDIGTPRDDIGKEATDLSYRKGPSVRQP